MRQPNTFRFYGFVPPVGGTPHSRGENE